MKTMPVILSFLLVSTAQAGVYKCHIPDYKTVYQNTPCPEIAVRGRYIPIKKQSPAEIAKAEASYNAWLADQAVQEAAMKKAQQELQDNMYKQATLDAINRNAQAQEQLARSQEELAQAGENLAAASRQRGLIVNQPGVFPYEPYPNATPSYNNSQMVSNTAGVTTGTLTNKRRVWRGSVVGR